MLLALGYAAGIQLGHECLKEVLDHLLSLLDTVCFLQFLLLDLWTFAVLSTGRLLTNMALIYLFANLRRQCLKNLSRYQVNWPLVSGLVEHPNGSNNFFFWGGGLYIICSIIPLRMKSNALEKSMNNRAALVIFCSCPSDDSTDASFGCLCFMAYQPL